MSIMITMDITKANRSPQLSVLGQKGSSPLYQVFPFLLFLAPIPLDFEYVALHYVRAPCHYLRLSFCRAPNTFSLVMESSSSVSSVSSSIFNNTMFWAKYVRPDGHKMKFKRINQ